jgi:hypothetical protein
MNEKKADKVIELLGDLLQKMKEVNDNLEYIKNDIDDIRSNSSDLSELPRIKGAVRDSEIILKDISDKL